MFELELEAFKLAERQLIRKALLTDGVTIASPVTRAKLTYFNLATFEDTIVILTAVGEDFASYTESIEADSVQQLEDIWRITFSVYLPRFQAVAISQNIIYLSNESNRLTAIIAGQADMLGKFPGATVKTIETYDLRQVVDPVWDDPSQSS